MAMTLIEARRECERWLQHLKAQEDRAAALQRLAAQRRAGELDSKEGAQRVAQIQGGGVTVYDGSRLAEAVRLLLSHANIRG